MAVEDKLRATFRRGDKGGAGDAGAPDAARKPTLDVHEGNRFSTPDIEDVVKLAEAAAAKGIDNPEIWGDNAAQKPGLNMIALAVLVYRHLIGYTLATTLGQIMEQLELLKGKARVISDDLVRLYDDYEGSRDSALRLKARMRRQGATLGKRRWAYYVLVVAIAVGEGCMMTVAFQVMALSNTPVLSFLPFVNELSIAASTAILSVLLLADYAGISLRGLLHDVEQHFRPAELRDPEARIRWGKVIGTVGPTLCAFGAIISLAAIRSSYFAAAKIHASSMAFIGIQMAFWAAALGLSYLTSGPFDREYKHATAREAEATAALKPANEMFWALVSQGLVLSHRIRTVTTEAVHHTKVSAADVRRLVEAYQHYVRLASIEPVTGLLFPEESLPEIRDYSGQELLEILNGPLALPIIEPIDTTEVEDRKAECEAYLTALRAELRATLPGGKTVPEQDDDEQ